MKKTLYILPFIALILSTFSCSKSTTIFDNYKCQSQVADSNYLRTVLDANNDFSLTVPDYWKTELYLTKNTSIFTTADTSKQFSKTYLIKASLITSNLDLNETTINTIKTKITAQKNVTIKSFSQGTFNNNPAIIFLAKEGENKSEKTTLHLYSPISPKQYFEIEIHCYGHKNVKSRFCEAINYINSLKIIEI